MAKLSKLQKIIDITENIKGKGKLKFDVDEEASSSHG